MKPEHFATRTYRILSSPLLLAAGIVLLVLPLLCLPTALWLSLPGSILLVIWGFIAAHRPPEGDWQPRHITIDGLADCSSIAISPELLLSGNYCIPSVAAPLQISNTLSMRSQSSSFLLASAAALTCNRHADPAVASAIRQALTSMGIEPEKMMSRWRVLSYDAPAHTWGVTVQDGAQQRCFFLGDPLMLVLTCRWMMTGTEQRITHEDRTALMQTLDTMRRDGASVIGYAMVDSPERPLKEATFLGMLALENEAHPYAADTLATLSQHFALYADLPPCNLPTEVRRSLLPTAKCSERALTVTTGKRRGPSLQLKEGAQDPSNWHLSLLSWQSFASRLRFGAFMAAMLLPAGLLWLVLALFQFSQPALALPLIFPMGAICLIPCRKYPALPKAWLIWPVITAAAALVLSLPTIVSGVPQPFAPGIAFTLSAMCAFATVPCALSPAAVQKKVMFLSAVAALAVMLPTWLLLCPGSTFCIVIACLGIMWGLLSCLGLRMHISKRE